MLKKFIALALLLGSLTFVPTGLAAEYKVDMAHSNVGFSIPILGGLSRVRGKFGEFAVTINYDEADVTKSSVTAVIKADSIDTGIAARDEHLRKADFFEVEKFPQITFKSSRVEKKGDQLLVHGTFTMHGISKEIVLPITMTGKLVNPETKAVTYGFSSNIKLDRRDYGISYQRKGAENFLGNEVEIELVLLAKPPM
jgi:polyisoprenoid-binding protein YceI